MAVLNYESTDAEQDSIFPRHSTSRPKKQFFDVKLVIPEDNTAFPTTIETEIAEILRAIRRVHLSRTTKNVDLSSWLLLSGVFEHIETRTKTGVKVRVFTTPGKSIRQDLLWRRQPSFEFLRGHLLVNSRNPLPALDLICPFQICLRCDGELGGGYIPGDGLTR